MGEVIDSVSRCAVVFFAAAAAFFDTRERRIPDKLIVLGSITGLCLACFLGTHGLTAALFGGLAAAIPLLLLTLLFDRARGAESMGGGDIKLVFMLGLYLGWVYNILALMLGSILGSLYMLIFRRALRGQAIPFAPMLFGGTVIAVLFGSEILKTFFSL